jgi:hypothetical protein
MLTTENPPLRPYWQVKTRKGRIPREMRPLRSHCHINAAR